MANEYRVTQVAAEVVDANPAPALVTSIAAEVSQTDDNATDILVTSVAAEVSQVDDNATDILVTQVALEVLRTINDATPGTIHFGAVSFTPEGQVAFGTFLIAHSLSVTFRGELSFGLHARAKNPICAPPAFKSWARIVPPAKSWACVTVVPAEECEGVDSSTASDLDYVSGDRLITLDGYGLKLVS